jgi:hypothetical protein
VKQIAMVRDVVGLLPKAVEEPSTSHQFGRPLLRGHADHYPARNDTASTLCN